MEDPEMVLNPSDNKYPYCIVWTPIPLLTKSLRDYSRTVAGNEQLLIGVIASCGWIFPFVGHMGICTSAGIIRDFGGSYYVGKDRMAFGNPTKYWQMNPNRATSSWDQAVSTAAEVYQARIHNLCCDNCHSMVALALNKMQYDGSTSWNMVKLCFLMLIHGKYVSASGFLKSNLPFLIFLCLVVVLIVFST